MIAEKEAQALKDAIKSDSSSDEEGEWVIKADSGAYDYEGISSAPEKDVIDGASNQPYDVEIPVEPSPVVSVSELNTLKSAIMRAELQGNSEEAAKLQAEYDTLSGKSTESSTGNGSNLKILDSAEIHQLHGLEQVHKKSAQDMTIVDMVREEKLDSAGRSGRNTQELDMARQIGRDSGYEHGDTDYAFDNAEKLSKAHTLSSEDARKLVVERTRLLNTITDDCSLCIVDQDTKSSRHRKVVPISIGTRVYLCAAPEPALAKGASVIVPMEHRRNTQMCDDDEWEEIRNFMKCLTQMWSGYGKGVIFYENAVPASASGGGGDRMHACIHAIPVPISQMDAAPAIFREAMEMADEEWSTHRKVISTMKVAADATKQGNSEAARFAFRTSIAKEAPYFHVWFNINGGLGHIVEDRDRWPRGDLFAREILGSIVRADVTVVRRRTKWSSSPESSKFLSKWPMFDWTKQLD